MIADPIAGDWYLRLGDQPFDADVLPRYSLRGGRVFTADHAAQVGSYSVRPDKVVIAIGGDEIITVGLPGITENQLSGTLTALDGDDAVRSDPAMLLRAIGEAAAH